MTENPYAATNTNDLPVPQEKAVDMRLLQPAIRFLTIVFVLDALVSTGLSLRALYYLRDVRDQWATLYTSYEYLWVAIQTSCTLGYPAAGLYIAVRTWQYRVMCEELIHGEVTWEQFAHAHTVIWRSTAIYCGITALLFLIGELLLLSRYFMQ